MGHVVFLVHEGLEVLLDHAAEEVERLHRVRQDLLLHHINSKAEAALLELLVAEAVSEALVGLDPPEDPAGLPHRNELRNDLRVATQLKKLHDFDGGTLLLGVDVEKLRQQLLVVIHHYHYFGVLIVGFPRMKVRIDTVQSRGGQVEIEGDVLEDVLAAEVGVADLADGLHDLDELPEVHLPVLLDVVRVLLSLLIVQ